MFGNMKKATIAPKEDSDYIPMKDIVGEVVAFELVAYDPSFDGKYGPTARATVNLVVTTGEHKGTREKNRYLSGNIATQLSESMSVGESTASRIASGPSGKGNDWVGLETISDDDFDEAVKVASKKAKKMKKK